MLSVTKKPKFPEVGYMRFVDILQETSDLIVWQSAVIPGLLQTADYARAVGLATVDLGAGTNEKSVAYRMEWQQAALKRIASDDMQATLLIDEAVLCRVVAGKKVMREQLNHLLSIMDLGVKVHVWPLSAGPNPVSLGGGLYGMRFPGESTRDTLVYCEQTQSLPNNSELTGALAEMAFERLQQLAAKARQLVPDPAQFTRKINAAEYGALK